MQCSFPSAATAKLQIIEPLSLRLTQRLAEQNPYNRTPITEPYNRTPISHPETSRRGAVVKWAGSTPTRVAKTLKGYLGCSSCPWGPQGPSPTPGSLARAPVPGKEVPTASDCENQPGFSRVRGRLRKSQAICSKGPHTDSLADNPLALSWWFPENPLNSTYAQARTSFSICYSQVTGFSQSAGFPKICERSTNPKQVAFGCLWVSSFNSC